MSHGSMHQTSNKNIVVIVVVLKSTIWVLTEMLSALKSSTMLVVWKVILSSCSMPSSMKSHHWKWWLNICKCEAWNGRNYNTFLQRSRPLQKTIFLAFGHSKKFTNFNNAGVNAHSVSTSMIGWRSKLIDERISGNFVFLLLWPNGVTSIKFTLQ